ncbi:MAG TPA: DUF423 domain-containing protein [Gammaproteobacteria bacterium]|nr:DUF423 domain-containing protein [Gammaproteobacteria bacterium]
MSSARFFLVLGSVNAAIAIVLGAFGAHALHGRLSARMLDVWHVAERYQLVHALGLLALGLLALVLPHLAGLRWAGGLMLAGILLFCGSLYLLALTGYGPLGMITPFGGMCFILAWGVLAWAVWRGL